MEFATIDKLNDIVELYRYVIEEVNKSDIKLGWNIEIYPDKTFVEEAIKKKQMCIVRKAEKIIAAAVVNHNVNDEYNDIDWQVKGPANKLATIHALAVSPDMRGKTTSDYILAEIEKYCVACGDTAIHLDVIDTNIPAYKLYMRNGYTEIDCIRMFYEVVGTREFWMLEKVL